MAKESKRQKEIVGRVMHEFKHGELESQGGKVRNPRQAIAIGLSEAGASNRKSPAENRKSRGRTEAKERQGKTAKQVKEGRTGKSRASGATTRTSSRTRAARGGPTRAELYEEARRRGIGGCSRMSKADLERVLRKR